MEDTDCQPRVHLQGEGFASLESTWSARRLRERMGVPSYTFRRLLLLAVCILGVVQYGMVTVFGVIAEDLESYYGITSAQGDDLYSWLNFGSCALSFIPGICYDRLGAVTSMALGTICGVAPLVLQLTWTEDYPPWLDTQTGLILCYLLFGLAASFYNVIGCFAPLAGFPDRDAGKVSAVVQVFLSLGLTVQSAVYSYMKGRNLGGDFFESYLIYMLAFTGICGVLMCIVLKACHPILYPAPVSPSASVISNDPTSPSGSPIDRAAPANQHRSIWRILWSPEFAVMSMFFLLPVGFTFSFLDVEGRIAKEAAPVVTASFLARNFGIINAFGRVLASVPLDYTKKYAFGGVYVYVAASLFVVFAGLLFLIVPPTPQRRAVNFSNNVMALGYGGMMGVIPPALRTLFGPDSLGLIYGILYFWVYVALTLWGKLAQVPDDCRGVACYRPYCLGGALGTLLVTVIFVAMLVVTGRRQRWRGRAGNGLLADGCEVSST